MSHPIPTMEYELEEDLYAIEPAPFVSNVEHEFGNVDEYLEASSVMDPKTGLITVRPIQGSGLNTRRLMDWVLFGDDPRFRKY